MVDNRGMPKKLKLGDRVQLKTNCSPFNKGDTGTVVGYYGTDTVLFFADAGTIPAERVPVTCLKPTGWTVEQRRADNRVEQLGRMLDGYMAKEVPAYNIEEVEWMAKLLKGRGCRVWLPLPRLLQSYRQEVEHSVTMHTAPDTKQRVMAYLQTVDNVLRVLMAIGRV